MKKILIIIFFITESLTLVAQSPLKIMPLGDSITRGSSVTNNNFGRAGYRKPLIDSLISLGYTSTFLKGYDFDFVGSQNLGTDTINFDKNHEGYSGWHASDPENTSISILHNLKNILNLNPPDVILLHIGTNDISDWDEVDSLVNDVSNLLDTIFNFNSNINVIIAKIIKRVGPDSLIDTTVAFNKALETMTNLRINNGDNLHLVDMEAGAGLNYVIGPNTPPNPAFDMGDNLHPNNNGYRKIANVWFNKLKELLTPALAFPPDGSIAQSTTVTFGWNPAVGANTYRLQVSTDPAFNANIIFDDSTLTDTFAVVTLQEDINYYWHVNAKINTGSSSFSEVWTLTTPLPVELSAFNLILKDNNVELFWQTETEVNNLGFNIERNINRGQWEVIEFVQGNGNSNSTKNYFYTDKNLTGGSKFIYRLKQIDFDGTFSFSNEIEVDVIPDKFMLFQNYPNPFNPLTNIKFNLPDYSKVRLEIYNILSEHILTLINEEMQPGYYNIPFDAGYLPSGIYIYKIQTDDNIKVNKMMLLK